MSSKPLTPPELRRAGLRILIERLGPSDTIRFLHQYDSGDGDYTKQREDLLKDLSLDDVLRDVGVRRRHG